MRSRPGWQLHHRLGVPALAVAVVAGSAGGFVALSRAFRTGLPLEPWPSPSATVTAGPPVTPRPGELTGGRACLTDEVVGEFDGDGRLDTARVYPKASIEPPQCAHPALSTWIQEVSVALATGTRLRFEFGCTAVLCRFRGSDQPGGPPVAPDFDGDGRAELAISVSQGATFSLFAVYRVTPRGPLQLRLAPAGDPEGQLNHELSPGPVRFLEFSDLYGRAWVSCRTSEDGSRVVVQERARRVGDGTNWSYHETVLAFDGETFTVTSSRSEIIPDDSRLFANPGLTSCD